MLRENLVYAEGVVDVGILVPLCFKNPLRECAVGFVKDVLTGKRKALIPLTTIIGAYHIATRYLKIPRIHVKKVLSGLIATRSPALYPQIPLDIVLDALEYATIYNVESWDGYLVALALNTRSKIIYTMDRSLERVKEIIVVNPFPEEKVREYHRYLKSISR